MKIHEYQAKAILARYGVTTPRSEVAFTKEEAREGANRLKSNVIVVKAQIHAGGRGKAGGVKLVHSPDEAAEVATRMLGMNLVTIQTGPSGRIVKRLLIEEGLDIKRELYLSLLVDRSVGRVVFMASGAGGMEIEEVAKNNPDAIIKEVVHPAVGLQPYQARKLAFGLGLTGEVANNAAPFFQALHRAFVDTDASMLEINPCVLTGDGKLVALDAKMTSTTTAFSVTRICVACATSMKKILSKSKPRNTASTTSSSKAASAAWSTAPVSPWQRWTSSNTRAARPQISSMLEAALLPIK